MTSRDWVPAAFAAGLAALMIWLAGEPLAPPGEARLELLAPRGEVPEFPRRFAWTELPGATLYEIFVAPATPGAQPVFRQRGPSSVLTLEFDDGAEPPPGRYGWEVLALRDERILARASGAFSVSSGP